jgi:hypothetical protein
MSETSDTVAGLRNPDQLRPATVSAEPFIHTRTF